MADATFLRTDEQTMLGSTLRELLTETVDLDRTRSMSLTVDAFDEPAWRGLADMGLVALAAHWEPEGSEPSFTDLAVVFEELGRAVASVPLLSVLMTAAVLGQIDGPAAEALRTEIADGGSVPALAVFEHEHADHVAAGGVVAERAGDGWRIRGTKRYVIDAPIADRILITARSGDDVVLAVVPAAGVEVEPVHALDATRPLGHVRVDAVVDGAEVLAVGGPDVERAIGVGIDVGLVAMASEQVGGAQRCLESSVEYASTRFQFGRAIGSFQAVKHACADMLVAVEHARSVAWHAAATFDDAEERDIAVPLAHSVCSDAYEWVAGQAIQVHGGIGFTWEHDAHLYLKRAKASSLLLRSVSASRDRLGDAIGV